MSRELRNSLIFGVVWFVGLPGAVESMPKAATSPSHQITIRVFNFAQVKPETWNVAQKVAAEVFIQIGINTIWLDCHLSAEGTYTLPECDRPVRPTDFVLRLVPASAATRAQFGDSTLGIAARPEEGTPASASVFYDRVKKLANGGDASIEVILGHAAAHEIGHLLLGSNSHSPLGLMRGSWSRQDLQRASAGELLFTSGQALLIRQEVSIRVYNYVNVRHETLERAQSEVKPPGFFVRRASNFGGCRIRFRKMGDKGVQTETRAPGSWC